MDENQYLKQMIGDLFFALAAQKASAERQAAELEALRPKEQAEPKP